MGTNRGFEALIALCAALLASTLVLPAGGAEAGILQGTVTLSRSLAAHRMKFGLYADANRAGSLPETLPTADEVQNAVVYLEHVQDGAAPTRETAPSRMEQEGLTFRPHVLTVVKGTLVEFPNRDLLFHNVFSLSKPASFDLGRFPKNASKAVRFAKPGIVKVYCHIHSDMSGVIVVLDNPFFASPSSDGRFVIDGIPPGDYRVVVWHERTRMTAKHVRIEAGRASNLDFAIPLSEDADGG